MEGNKSLDMVKVPWLFSSKVHQCLGESDMATPELTIGP